MQLRNKQDFWAGLMFMAIGLGFAYGATQYQMGTAARMGPGYFPFWLGICLALLAAVVTLSSLSPKAEKVEVARFDFKILIILIGMVILFGALLRPLGLYISLLVLVIGSSLASHEFNWKVAIGNAIFLVVFCWLAFVKGLGLIFPLWPEFLGG